MAVDDVLMAAREAEENGTDRLCVGAPGRGVKDADLPQLTAMISAGEADKDRINLMSAPSMPFIHAAATATPAASAH